MRGVVTACCVLMAIPAAAEEARYVVRGSQLPVSVAHNGYVQSVTPRSPGEAEVQVATALVPVGAKGSYGAVASPPEGVPEGFVTPRALQSRLRPEIPAWEAATEVLRWVAVHLRIDEDDGPQDAAAVLARRGGRCSGVANAAAALLMDAGFEARTVSGLLITDAGPVPHRWLICRLPGAGWVPTDPTLGLWVVTPRHLAFGDTVTEVPRVEVAQPAGGGGIGRLPHWRGRPLRPNLGSELVCRLVGDGSPERALAVLYGGDGEVRRAVLDPEGRFESLLPGRWRLVVVADGRVLEERDVDLAPAQVHSFTVARSPQVVHREVGS